MVHVQPAVMRDALTLRQWRNDPSVRRWSSNTDVIGMGEYLGWFLRARSSARHVILVGVEPVGTRVGTVQYREDDPKVWVVSITVAPGRQGKGHGTGLLTYGEAWLRGHHVAKELHALVRPDNAASQRIFGRCGFAPQGTDDLGFDRLVKDLGETQ